MNPAGSAIEGEGSAIEGEGSAIEGEGSAIEGEGTRPRVLIVGGGPAGLAAAWALADAPVDVVIVESRDRPGGLGCSADDGDGFVFDHGVHGFFASRPETEPVMVDVRRIMAGRYVECVKRTSLLFRGHFLSYPLGLRDLFRALDPWTALVGGLSFLRARIARRLGKSGDDRTFRGWSTNRYGKKLCDIYFAPYAEKTWGIPATELSSAQLARRVTSISLWAVLIGALKKLVGPASTRPGEYSQQPPGFIYGLKGSASLVEALLEQIDRPNIEVVTSTIVAAVEQHEGQVSAAVLRDQGRDRRLAVDFLITTIPLHFFAPLFAEFPGGDDMQTAASGLRYRSMVIVNLKVRREHVLDAQWTYFPDRSYCFNRVNEYKYFHHGLAPPGHTGLGVEITCFAGDDTWVAPDEALYRRVLDDLLPTGLLAEDEIIGFGVMRIATAYPIGDVTAEDNMRAIHEFVDHTGNLYLAGRQAEFRYINSDEAIYSGRRAALDVLARLAATPVNASASSAM